MQIEMYLSTWKHAHVVVWCELLSQAKGLSFSQTADLLGFSLQESQDFTDSGAKNREMLSEQEFTTQRPHSQGGDMVGLF